MRGWFALSTLGNFCTKFVARKASRMTPKRVFSTSNCVAVILVLILLLAVSQSAYARETVLHAFQGRPGMLPASNLVSDAAGNLYGTTWQGGSKNCTGAFTGCGIVFKLTPTSSGWSYSVLYVFKGGHDGANPIGNLTFDAAGNLYGATQNGGDPTCFNGEGCGTVFELSPLSGGGWKETVLHVFSGHDGDGPVGGVILDSAGNLYGTTSSDGGTFGYGTVFELTPGAQGEWTETTLYAFQQGNDGTDPHGDLLFDKAGNLYGTTYRAGTGFNGTVFKLTHSNGSWNESILYNFSGGSDGGFPLGGLIFDAAGNLYGTTQGGGEGLGYGVVFELSPSHGSWAETVLLTFTNADGAYPQGDLIFDAAGNLFGTAANGGNAGCGPTCGSVFELTPNSGGGWTESILYKFTGGKDGAIPLSTLRMDSVGNLYGTAFIGGNKHAGVVFKIVP
jgi:uncharacterized repeat protein (TIGR03803 family)